MKIYRLKESKTNQLKKLLNNGNITEEQFNIADKFFKTYSAFENEIDWNRGLNITWDDLREVIYKERNSESKTRKKIRKGLEGFEEGKDYLVLEETDSYVAYQPFTWEASRMIASHYVEPSINDEGEVEDANWCTAYQKNNKYWNSHNKMEAFIYICGEFIPTKKVAISISEEDYDANDSEFLYSTDNLNFNIWDFDDYNDTIEEEEILEVVPNLYDLMEKAYNNWKIKYEESFISKLKLNPQTNRYDYDGNLDIIDLKRFISNNYDGFTINFGKITGSFNCSELGITSLKGAPTEVDDYFDCSRNNLTSLEGAPHKIGRWFDCQSNYLTSLEGSPQEVGENFWCSDNQLTSLKGAPKTVGENFWCSDNRLTSLKGAPKIVGGSFDCSRNNLTSLEGAPKTVDGNFDCHNNYLPSLEGAPQTVDGSFDCSYNQLTSLKGAPTKVGEGFLCYVNHLTSLEGAPKEVGGWFDCHNNYLTSLKGAPTKVGGYFDCRSNRGLHSLNGIGKVLGNIFKDF